MSPWRLGRHFKIHVHEEDRPVATFHRKKDAARAVHADGVLNKIRRLHRKWRCPSTMRDQCTECMRPWPCRTVQSLDGTR